MSQITRRTFAMISILTVSFIAMLTISGCGGSGPEGTWVIDKEATSKAMIAKAKAAGGPQAEMAEQMIGPMLDQMKFTVTLKSGGAAEVSISMMGESETTTGTWSSGGNAIKITVSDGNRKRSIEGTISGSTMTMQNDPGDPPITLKRS